MRLTDLQPGLVRRAHGAHRPYVPGRRARHRRVLWLAAGLYALSAGGVGEQSVLAVLSAGPSWAAALKAPDPGVALSPTVAAGPVVAAVGRPSDPPPAHKAARAPNTPKTLARALPTPITGVLAQASKAALPRGNFAMAAAPVPALKADAARARLASRLTAYAPQAAVETPFRMLLGPENAPPSAFDHWWSDRPLPRDVASAASVRCLTQAIYFEARGESPRGQRAVAQVVMNRVKNPAYPDTVCGVVFQNRSRRNACQFTFACDRVKDVVRNRPAWRRAKTIAKAYTAGEDWMPEIGAATHYHATRVSPKWARAMRRLERIDNHIFYLTKRGGWT
ncbi:MAG: cell wall hydrolase [Pseudomonadota bacterium]